MIKNGVIQIDNKFNNQLIYSSIVQAKISYFFYSKSSYQEWYIEIMAERGQNYYLSHLPFEAIMPQTLERQSYLQDKENELVLHTIFINGRGNIIFDRLELHFNKWSEKEQKFKFEMLGKAGNTSVHLFCSLFFEGFIFYDYSFEEIQEIQEKLKIPGKYGTIKEEEVGKNIRYKLHVS